MTIDQSQDPHVLYAHSVHLSPCNRNLDLTFWKPVSIGSLSHEMFADHLGNPLACLHHDLRSPQACTSTTADRATLQVLAHPIWSRRSSLKEDVHAHQILHHPVLSSGRRPDPFWKQLLGQPRKRLADQLGQYNTPPISLATCRLRGHGHGYEAAQSPIAGYANKLTTAEIRYSGT